MKTKYKIKVPVVGYVEKEVISNSLDEAIKEVNQLITTSYEIEEGTEFSVLDNNKKYNPLEIIEESPINKYQVSIPIRGYYSVEIEASSKEEAIDLVFEDSQHNKNLFSISNTYRENFDITDLALIENVTNKDIFCDLITS